MAIKITYTNHLDTAELGKVRKVYRTKYGYTPSGQHKYYYVWNDRLGRCTWVKDTNCELVA